MAKFTINYLKQPIEVLYETLAGDIKELDLDGYRSLLEMLVTSGVPVSIETTNQKYKVSMDIERVNFQIEEI